MTTSARRIGSSSSHIARPRLDRVARATSSRQSGGIRLSFGPIPLASLWARSGAIEVPMGSARTRTSRLSIGRLMRRPVRIRLSVMIASRSVVLLHMRVLTTAVRRRSIASLTGRTRADVVFRIVGRTRPIARGFLFRLSLLPRMIGTATIDVLREESGEIVFETFRFCEIELFCIL